MAIVKGKEVLGLNIVTIDDGRVIGVVKDIAYDPSTQRIGALIVSDGGLFKSAKAVSMDDIHNIGEDAVVVPTDSALKSIKNHDESIATIVKSDKHLVQTNILTVEGKNLGYVSDIYFDSSNGSVSSMEVSQGGLKLISEGKKSILPSDIVTIGANATIVTAYTESKLETQGEQGGLNGIVNDAKGKAAVAASNAQNSLKDMTDATQARASEIAGDVRNGANELAERTNEQIDSAGERISKTMNDAKGRVNNGKEAIEDRFDNQGSTGNNPSLKMVKKRSTKSFKVGNGKKTVKRSEVIVES